MGFVLLLMFIGVPIAEIAVFIQAGDAFGLWPTVGAVVGTAVLGSILLRSQGLSLLFKARENMEQGVFPVKEAFDGICLVVAGALLLTPGFITDTVGFLLFVPPLRAGLRGLMASRMTIHTQGAGAAGFTAQSPGAPFQSGQPGNATHSRDPRVIDGEFVEITPEETAEMDSKNSNPNSPWSGS